MSFSGVSARERYRDDPGFRAAMAVCPELRAAADLGPCEVIVDLALNLAEKARDREKVQIESIADGLLAGLDVLADVEWKPISPGTYRINLSHFDFHPQEKPMSFDPSKPFKTRGGREAKIFMTDGGGVFPLLGAIKRPNGQWSNCRWAVDGRNGYGEARLIDLVNTVETKVRYLPVGMDGYMTPQQASNYGRAQVQKITYEDGKAVSVELVD